MTAKKYFPSNTIGPNSILFIEEVEYYISAGGNKYRQGIFECPYCKNNFKAQVQHIASGHTKSCGCLNNPNLIGKTFGQLTIIEKADKVASDNHQLWKCQCSCGKEIYVRTNTLTTGQSKSCGCLNNPSLAGKTFGKLTALEETKYRSTNGNRIWKCQCECGNITYVSTNSLNTHNTTSCGCILSKGENLIEKLLLSIECIFEKQKTFSQCINPETNALLRFDFYLPDYNCCIEYDGQQHFYATNTGWNTEKNLTETQYRDSIKNQYCKDNGIKLIRIPYTDYDKLNEEYLLSLITTDTDYAYEELY